MLHKQNILFEHFVQNITLHATQSEIGSFYIHMSLHCEISMYSVFYLCEAAPALCCHTVFVIAHLRVARPRLYHSNCPIPSNKGSRSLAVIGQFHTTVPVLSGGGGPFGSSRLATSHPARHQFREAQKSSPRNVKHTASTDVGY